MLPDFLPGGLPAYVPFTGQILPLSYMAGKLETPATVPEGGFCCQWYINHILARNSTTETWQWLFPSPSSNTHVCFLQSPPREASPKQQMVCCVQQLAPLHTTPSFSRDCMCEPACLCVCVCRSTHDFQLPFSAFCISQPKMLGNLARSPAMSPDVQLWYSFLPSLPAGAGFIQNHK